MLISLEKGKKIVMVIDDEPLIRTMLLEVLTCAGYFALGARDGDEALRLTETEPLDLVLVDHHLSDTDGLTLQRQIKDIKPDVKFIFMSGSHDPKILLAAQEEGADAILTKPFDVVELLQLVSKL